MELNNLINLKQYSLERTEKRDYMNGLLAQLNDFHLNNSLEYKQIKEKIWGRDHVVKTLEDLPFIPVSAFKNHQIKSIAEEEIFKVLTSSGTTGQQVSKIYLDKETAKLQTFALSKIISHVVGTSRLPMLIIDSKSIFSNKSSFSARGAGVLGVSIFGKDHTYVLDDKFEPDEEVLKLFLEKHNGKPILIFGFTFMVWQYLFNANLKNKYDLSKAILIHSGGWKKLIDIAVDNPTFRNSLKEKFNLKHIYNFYGMVEQVGSVFLENSDGYLHCPNFADVIIRNPYDFSVQPPGKEGLIQVISALPKSYPGHSLLTEDIGVLMGEDDASNGWKGKYFKIIGRAKRAELRGCSDTFKTK
ncbi:acyl-protein synthetase [Flavobacterium sp. LS1R10]|uniref:LuxE/PaaK family acyltransferase n=1 Tax=Flavobacterium sp. LS1R10 TaxID=2497482 RepID=UPI000F825C98|nr:acyl-protein synthetase [Flavobacterium sp. LS1R10]RTY74258.1 acyl-protein synthetase [Flavobacterium sp. LS1R10]